MKRVLPLVLALALPIGAAAAPRPGPRPAAKPQLVFFMNPYGRPCQMQDQILREMGPELGARVEVVYVKTTEARDLERFRQYGIRSLPTLVVTDASGRELRRATPGIQSAAQVRQLIGS
jgi:thioredoxin 1